MMHGAKVAAVEFALFHLLGPAHGKDLEEITERLGWRRIGRPAKESGVPTRRMERQAAAAHKAEGQGE